MFLSLSIFGVACQNDKAHSFTDAEIQDLRVKIEKDPLWKEYVSAMHTSMHLVTSKNLYVDEALYKNPPQLDSKLANVKSTEEALQVLLRAGLTEANAKSVINWSECFYNLHQKFPEMAQVGQEKLNLQIPPPEGYPLVAPKTPKDFLDNQNKTKQ